MIPFSTQIAAVLVNILVQVLPYVGVQVGSDQLTQTIQTIVAIATGLWIWYKRTQLTTVGSNAQSDVNIAGIKK